MSHGGEALFNIIDLNNMSIKNVQRRNFGGYFSFFSNYHDQISL